MNENRSHFSIINSLSLRGLEGIICIIQALLLFRVPVLFRDNRLSENGGAFMLTLGYDGDYIGYRVEEDHAVVMLYDSNGNFRLEEDLILDCARAMRRAWQKVYAPELYSPQNAPRNVEEFLTGDSWADADAFAFVFMCRLFPEKVDVQNKAYDVVFRDGGKRRDRMDAIENWFDRNVYG